MLPQMSPCTYSVSKSVCYNSVSYEEDIDVLVMSNKLKDSDCLNLLVF